MCRLLGYDISYSLKFLLVSQKSAMDSGPCQVLIFKCVYISVYVLTKHLKCSLKKKLKHSHKVCCYIYNIIWDFLEVCRKGGNCEQKTTVMVINFDNYSYLKKKKLYRVSLCSENLP